MTKTPLIIGSFCLAALTMNAEVLTPEQALGRANAQGPAKIISNGQNAETTRLLLTTYQDNLPSTYVFGKDGGYMVLAADDVAVPVLGYSDEGSIDPENLPDGLKYWLDFYGQEIAAARMQGVQPAKVAARASDYAAIEPMVKTKWDQGSPYNDLCPATSGGQHAVTGCVATAMAQMMKYHNYPPKGQGTCSNSSSGLTPITINFAEYNFDWANMLNVYDKNATQTQKTAVAELMVCAGVSVSMKYTTGMSGAASQNIARALIEYFNYDKGVHYLERDYYSLSEWTSKIYDQLSNIGPVVYAGTTADSEGHCFVCDGYSKDGFFHFNWGWGGLSDGYFLLTSLDPEAQGIGGASDAGSGFNYKQDIILGKVKPEDGSKYYEQILCPTAFKITQPNVSQGSSVTIPIRPYSGSGFEISGTLGLQFEAQDGTKKYFAGPSFKDVPHNNYICGSEGYKVTISGLGNGTYTVTPMWMSSNYEQHPILTPINNVRSYKAVVSGNSVVFTVNAYDANVAVSDIKLVSPKAYVGKRNKFSIKINNSTNSEYYDMIAAGLYNKGAKSGDKPASVGTQVLIDIEPGQTLSMDYISAFASASAGSYEMYFYNPATYEFLSSKFDITLEEAPSNINTVMEITNFRLLGEPDPSNMIFEFDATCKTGLWDGKMLIALYEDGKNYARTNFSTPSFLLYEGESKEVTAPGSISSYKEGVVYNAYLFKGTTVTNERIAGPVAIVFGESGIEGVEADSAAPVYYNLQGVRVDDVQTGQIYIKVQDGQATKVKF